jgi:hypothetical protein
MEYRIHSECREDCPYLNITDDGIFTILMLAENFRRGLLPLVNEIRPGVEDWVG